jgi:hypothetical protein
VEDWAPQIENRTLATPLTSIHGGTPVTETAASITWIAVTGPLQPGQSADLAVALGPLPSTSQMTFTVIPTYADGKVGPAMPPATLKLTPAAGQAATGHTGHGGTTGTGSSPDDAAFAAVVAQADQGPGFWSIAGWVVAALAVAGAVLVMLRGRRRSGGEPDDDAPEDDAPEDDAREGDEDDDEGKEPVATGAKVTAWSYRDGPG